MTSKGRTAMNVIPGDELAPGMWVKTIEEGADTPVYLSLLLPNEEGPKGQFVAEREGRNSRKSFWKPSFSTFVLAFPFSVLDWENVPSTKEMGAKIGATMAEKEKKKVAVVSCLNCFKEVKAKA